MTWNVPARIETERLVIRRYARTDAEALAAVASRNREHLVRYLPWARYEPQTAEQRIEYIAVTDTDFDEGRDYTMGIFARETGELVGGTGFHPRKRPVDHVEIGYWIDAARQGQGLVTETVAALTRVALELLKVPFVGIVHAPTNARSEAVPERLGYVRQAPLDAPTCTDGDRKVVPVAWQATLEHLPATPVAATPRPTVFDAEGMRITWPA
ncbi:GNAT family N-acetyltransferase [Demequina salsinemoris]|uniref:GNAT family N-acetyltransferase n=1 Tax=Demequina salsinemoris TaxID=577470 RepID=UPI000785A5D1|nr:GNAT family N-acetyltransferase [Demequina salsinemoris]